MILRSLWNDDSLLWTAFLLSLGAHVVLFKASDFSFRLPQKHIVEIDITNMGRLGMSSGAPKAAPPPPKPRPATPPKVWTKPAPNQKMPVTKQEPVAPEEPPAPVAPPAAPSEYGIGTGDDSSTLSRIPQLLNLSDLGAILKRFYPEEARARHLEGIVTLDLHIDTDGRIQAIDVVKSGGDAFDAAATKVARLLRFTPAFVGSRRVAVKMRQTIQFKLEGE